MKNKYYLYAICTIILWGTSSLTIMKLNMAFTGLQTLAFAFLLATIFLFILALCQRKLSEIKTYKFKDFAIIFGLGLLGIFAYNMLNTYSYIFATGTQAVTINYLWPLWTVIFAMIILKEKVTLGKIIAMLISFFGMALVATRGDFGAFANTNILGICQALLCSICYGLFSAITKKVKYDKTVATMLYFASGTIVAFICLFAFSSVPHFTFESTLWLVLRGCGQFGLAYMLWTMALMGDTVRVSNLALITPFLQLAAISLFMGEVIGIMPILGLICIVGGTIIARRD